MRLSTDPERDEARALDTIAAAAEAGITVFDTARAYGHGEHELGHNERLLSRALRGIGAEAHSRIVTKGGMRRLGSAWAPDGRAKAIRADCEASLASLDGLPIDLYLLHAPDPRTPWRTSVRALARLVDERLVRAVGVSNVNRRQLDEALEIAPLAAAEVPLSLLDDVAIRGGVVERCREAGLALIAHSPLGGPRRAAGLARRPELLAVANRLGTTPEAVALAWVLGLGPGVVAIPGARRPETARSAARAATLALSDEDLAVLAGAFGRGGPERPAPPRARTDTEVVMVMGIPGAGKSRLAADHVARGYVRLNRDERGGTLLALAGELEATLASGASRVVLDNTYLTRAARRDVVDAARRHGARVRCIWIDSPLAQAQVNLVERLLDRFGRLPSPEALRERRREPGVLAPTSQMRALRELEPPAEDEGFASVERLAFVRSPSPPSTAGGVFVAAAALREPGWRDAVARGDPAAPHLVFDWRPGGSTDDLEHEVADLSAVVSSAEPAVCPHGGGAPICWCRPPLPGLLLAFARSNGLDPGRSTLVGTSAAHRSLAATLGARYVEL